MVPLPDTRIAPARSGAGQVSLQMLGELGVLVALMLVSTLGALLLLASGDAAWKLAGMGAIGSDGGALVQVGLTLGAMALPLVWIARRWPALELTPLVPPSAGFGIGVAAGALGAAISYPTHWLGQLTGNDLLPSNAAEVERLLQGPWLLALFALVVVPPIAEEIVFRKFLLARFLKSGFPLLGIALTSVVFALMHEPFPADGQGVVGWALLLVEYCVAGAFFATAYCITGRLSAAIVAHATNNLIVCVVHWASL